MSDLLKLSYLNKIWIFSLVLKLEKLPLLCDQDLLLSLNYFVFAVKFQLVFLLSDLHSFFYDLERLGLSTGAGHSCSFGKDCPLFGHGNFLFKDHGWRAERLIEHRNQRRLALDRLWSVVIVLLLQFLDDFACIFFILDLSGLFGLNQRLVNDWFVDSFGSCFARFNDELGVVLLLIFPLQNRVGRGSYLDLFRNHLYFMWLGLLHVKGATILLA